MITLAQSDDDYIRERAAIKGLLLSDDSVAAIRERWLRDPLCNLEALLDGIRNLRDKK